MNLLDGIILALIVGAAAAVLRFMRKQKKEGKCAGCPGCPGCGSQKCNKDQGFSDQVL